MVFADPARLRVLASILHPAVAVLVRARCTETGGVRPVIF